MIIYLKKDKKPIHIDMDLEIEMTVDNVRFTTDASGSVCAQFRDLSGPQNVIVSESWTPVGNGSYAKEA